MIWHSHEIADVLQELQVDISAGLTEQEATERLREYGKNCLQEEKGLTFRRAVTDRMRSPFTVLPIAVSCVLLFTGIYQQVIKNVSSDWLTPVLVILLTLGIALMGAIRHRRAGAATSRLRDLSAPETRVLRDGVDQIRSSYALVPGDILMLHVGDIVPADCRLIRTSNLRCDEGALTDATMPTDKCADCVFDDITPLAQRSNMVYAGTTITCGTATAVVVATGARSEMGHASDEQALHSLPKQKGTIKLQRWLTAISIVLGVVFLIIGLSQGKDRSIILLTAVVLAAATIPQGIDTLSTRMTVQNIKHMGQMRFRIRHPDAIKALGQIDVLCVEQDMLSFREDVLLKSAYVGHRKIYLNDGKANAPGFEQLIRLAALNTFGDDPVDKAILTVAKINIDLDELLLDMPRIGELLPTKTRKTSVHLAGEQALILVRGEWRSLLPLCTKGNIEEIANAAALMEAEGMQIMAVAYRLEDTAPSVYTAEALEHDLTCVGLLGLRIPLRTDIAQAVEQTGQLHTILFSDEPASVASAAAVHAGLADASNVLIAEELDALTDEQLSASAPLYNVCCGFNSAQKLRILSALQQQGHVVAATGWHSDDANLLTQADVGIARVKATDITKDAADITLTDDSFSVVITALQEGRRANAERTGLFVYLLCCVGILAIIGYGSLLNWWPLHRTAVLLLMLHIVLLALPTPLWLPLGVSQMVHKLREKK